MSIRPVDFNGMIQNTHEVSTAKTQEDQKPVVQQQNIQSEFVKEEMHAQQQVGETEESRQEAFRYGDKKGDGSGYEKKEQKKKKKKESDDGKVFVKGKYHSFDVKI